MKDFLVEYMPWLLSATTIANMWMAGQKLRLAWACSIASNLLWCLWIALSHNWGLLPANLVLIGMGIYNHFLWTYGHGPWEHYRREWLHTLYWLRHRYSEWSKRNDCPKCNRNMRNAEQCPVVRCPCKSTFVTAPATTILTPEQRERAEAANRMTERVVRQDGRGGEVMCIDCLDTGMRLEYSASHGGEYVERPCRCGKGRGTQ